MRWMLSLVLVLSLSALCQAQYTVTVTLPPETDTTLLARATAQGTTPQTLVEQACQTGVGQANQLWLSRRLETLVEKYRLLPETERQRLDAVVEESAPPR